MAQRLDVPAKPIPQPDDASRPFFEGAQRGELMIQRCTACGAYLAPGSRACTECMSEALEWTPASGRATLFTFAIMHQRYHPGFFEELPYNIAVVELAEGPRMMTNIVDCPQTPEALELDMPLLVTFEKVTDDISLPKFRPAKG
jgi:uncharacterized OB-fold protein